MILHEWFVSTWLALAVATTGYVWFDDFVRGNPEMTVMRGVLVTLYMGGTPTAPASPLGRANPATASSQSVSPLGAGGRDGGRAYANGERELVFAV